MGLCRGWEFDGGEASNGSLWSVERGSNVQHDRLMSKACSILAGVLCRPGDFLQHSVGLSV